MAGKVPVAPRSIIRSHNTLATRTRLPQSQPPGTHFRLTSAVAPANPQPVAGIPIGGQLPEHLTALQRRRPRARPPHTTLLAATAIPRFAALYRIESGRHVGTAPAHPKPHVGAKVLARDEIAEHATGNVAIRRKGPFGRQGGTDRLFHKGQVGFGILISSVTVCTPIPSSGCCNVVSIRARSMLLMGFDRNGQGGLRRDYARPSPATFPV